MLYDLAALDTSGNYLDEILGKTLNDTEQIDTSEIKDRVVELQHKLEKISQRLSNMVANRFEKLNSINDNLEKWKYSIDCNLEASSLLKKNILSTLLKPIENQFLVIILSNRKRNMEKVKSILNESAINIRILRNLYITIKNTDVVGMSQKLRQLSLFVTKYSELNISKFIESELEKCRIQIRDIYLTDMCMITDHRVDTNELLHLLRIYDKIGIIDNISLDLVTKFGAIYEKELVESVKHYTIERGINVGIALNYESCSLIYDHIPSDSLKKFLYDFTKIAVSIFKKFAEILSKIVPLLQENFGSKTSAEEMKKECSSNFSKIVVNFILRDLYSQCQCFSYPFDCFIDFSMVFECLATTMQNFQANFTDIDKCNPYYEKILTFINTICEKQFTHTFSLVNNFQFSIQNYEEADCGANFSYEALLFPQCGHKILTLPEKFEVKNIEEIRSISLKKLIYNILVCFVFMTRSESVNLPDFYVKSFLKTLENLIESAISGYYLFDAHEASTIPFGPNCIIKELFSINRDVINFFFLNSSGFVQDAKSKDAIRYQQDTCSLDVTKSLEFAIYQLNNFQILTNLITIVHEYLSKQLIAASIINQSASGAPEESTKIDGQFTSFTNSFYESESLNQIAHCVMLSQIRSHFGRVFIDNKLIEKISEINWMIDDLPTAHLQYVNDILQIASDITAFFSHSAPNCNAMNLDHDIKDYTIAIFCNEISVALLEGYSRSSSMCNSGGSAQRQLDILALSRSLRSEFCVESLAAVSEYQDNDSQEAPPDHWQQEERGKLSHIVEFSLKAFFDYVQDFTKALYLPLGAFEAWLIENRNRYAVKHLESLIHSIVFLSKKQRVKLIKDLGLKY